MKLCQKEDNIIQCFDAYDFNNRLWIYMELMDIGAMTDIILENSGKIDEQVCQYILKQVLIGLEYLHNNSILHRDIKSDNILMNSNGDIKVADFGFATQLTKKNNGRFS